MRWSDPQSRETRRGCLGPLSSGPFVRPSTSRRLAVGLCLRAPRLSGGHDRDLAFVRSRVFRLRPARGLAPPALKPFVKISDLPIRPLSKIS